MGIEELAELRLALVDDEGRPWEGVRLLIRDQVWRGRC